MLTTGRLNLIRYSVRHAMIEALRVQYLHPNVKMFSELRF
jgi:hypothetical protein